MSGSLEATLTTLGAEVVGLGVPRTAVVVALERMKRKPMVAVAGRVKAGKSTLVNAIVGRKVAATDDVECTRVSTHYEFGEPEAAFVHLLDGSPPVEVPLTNGMLPNELPWPTDAISHAVVRLPEAALTDVTLVDTPGLGTTTEANERATLREILGSENGGVRPESLIYVFRGARFADDIDFLAQFVGRAGIGSSSVIGVLSHADRVGPSDVDAATLGPARSYAARLLDEHRTQLADVVPVAGLLAEAARAGQIRERDAAAMVELTEIDEFDLELGEVPDPVAHGRLRRVLGDFGIRHGRAAAKDGAGGLIEWAEGSSGIRSLHEALTMHLVRRDRAAAGRRTLAYLEAAAYLTDDPMPVIRRISDARSLPELHPIQELDAWELLHARHPGHDLLAVLDTLLRAANDGEGLGRQLDTPRDELRDRAIDLAGQANRAAALSSDAVVVNAARTVARSYALIARRNR